MKSIRQGKRGRGRAGYALALGLSVGVLTGCDDLLDVELPAQLTDEVLTDPVGAGIQVNTIINSFENEMSSFQWTVHGHEDGAEIYLMSPSASSGTHSFPAEADWLNGFSTARVFANSLHQKLTDEWTPQQVPQRAQYLAIASLYEGAVYSWMASSLCEGAVDGGALMSRDQMHAEAERLLTRALTEIDAAGDFEVPFGIAPSARAMTYGLRAQHRWMAGNTAGAVQDAAQVPAGFQAWVLREATADRRNLPYYAGTASKFAELKGINDWWNGPDQPPNPVTGQTWPEVIPFTGYQHLGILPDGRAVTDDGFPIRTGDAVQPHPGREAAAVADTRVPFIPGTVQGVGTPTFINAKFASENDDIALVNWKEMVLIRAEAAGGETAIQLVNEIRAADGLPLVTYADPNNATQIKYMIIEERRRALFLEGRYYYTKLQNLDLLWFPRRSGTRTGGINYEGGVRFVMPENEYILNENLDIQDRGTGCSAADRPVL